MELFEISQEMIALVVTALLAVSEVLGTFDLFKNNSIFQLVVDLLKKLSVALGLSDGNTEIIIDFEEKKKRKRK